MANQPLVSVILPVYNKEKYIERAVSSVLNQTYKNIEIIIIDDASTDKTPEVLSKLAQKDSKIILLANKTNFGLVKALNRGISQARGKYVARLDDEDFWCDEKKIEKQVDFLEKNPDCVLVGGGAIIIDRTGREVLRYLVPEKDVDIRKAALVYSPFVHVTVIFRRSAWEKLGGYDVNFDGMEDWDLWLRMGSMGKFYNFQEFFVRYVGHQRGSPGYAERRYGKLGYFKKNLSLRKKYSKEYPNYKRAVLLCWLEYLYSILPLRHELWPLTFKLRKLFFRNYPYK